MGDTMTNELKYAIGLGIAGLIGYLIGKIKPAAAAEQPKYSCSGSPCYLCYQDVNGIFPSLAECEASCKPETVPVNIVVEEG
jgi:hypothetical protein